MLYVKYMLFFVLQIIPAWQFRKILPRLCGRHRGLMGIKITSSYNIMNDER